MAGVSRDPWDHDFPGEDWEAPEGFGYKNSRHGRIEKKSFSKTNIDKVPVFAPRLSPAAQREMIIPGPLGGDDGSSKVSQPPPPGSPGPSSST